MWREQLAPGQGAGVCGLCGSQGGCVVPEGGGEAAGGPAAAGAGPADLSLGSCRSPAKGFQGLSDRATEGTF